jgi:cytochrome b pre-mRNA-processing protein 3
MRSFKRDPDKTAELSQEVFDLMFADVDQNLREMGIGDMGVGKRVKAMAEGFYGRVEAYEKGLADDGTALGEALERNLYRKTSPSPTQTAAIAEYIRDQARLLDSVDIDSLVAGKLEFGPPPARRKEAE